MSPDDRTAEGLATAGPATSPHDPNYGHAHRTHSLDEILGRRRQVREIRLKSLANALDHAARRADPVALVGRVRRVVGTIIHAAVADVQVGEICELVTRGPNGKTVGQLMAEVVGFMDDEALLSPIGDTYGVTPRTEVRPTGKVQEVPVGPGLRGRVLDGMGNFIDGKDEVFVPETTYPVYAPPPDPMTRKVIEDVQPLGVRVLDGMLTCGEGQRMGIFAAAGGGKSTLLSMLVKGADVDITILALIGERGREVREFIEHDLGPDGMAKSVLVVATSDRSSMERQKAAFVATAIAEYFRDQGKRVLFLMD
ncbi:MAG: hypothetical protein AAFQ88_14660, partial [Pseudomonadota bacterium]